MKTNIKAFTLLEILIAITIVSILIVLTLFVVGKFKDHSIAMKCLMNIRTYGVAVLTMAADNQGELPAWDGNGAATSITGPPQFYRWLTTGKYLSTNPPLRCPLADNPLMAGVTDQRRFPYAGNSSLCYTFPKLWTIPAPSHRVVLAVEANHWDGFTAASNLNDIMWNGGSPGKDGGAYPISHYHESSKQRGLHCFFLDGSARLVVPTDGDWGKEPGAAPGKNAGETGIIFSKTQLYNLRQGTFIAQ